MKIFKKIINFNIGKIHKKVLWGDILIVIDLDECGVCEKCIPVCPKDLIEKKGYTMIIKDGCDDCGICLDMCPLGAIYEE